MDRQCMRILTYIVVASVVTLIISFIAVTILFKNNDINRDQFLIWCYFLSGTLTTIVIIYGVVAISNGSNEKQYRDYLKSKNTETDENK